MTANKDFKRLVRGRMQKTGESYTSARANLLKKTATGAAGAGGAAAAAASAASAATPTSDFAILAGMSDATLKAKTGCTWDRWVKALDRVDAHTWSHGEIATYVHEKYKVPGWWAQNVTVGYERIKGLRAIGQRRDGAFEATKSKTFAAPLGRLYRAFHDADARASWMPGVDFTVRTAKRNKTLRIKWGDGTPVEFYFSARGRAKAQVQVQHRMLPDKPAASRMKQFWEERFAALSQVLAS